MSGKDVVSRAVNGDVCDRVSALDLVDDVLAFRSLAEDGVLAVKVRSGQVCDEELRAVGVGACISHGEDAGLVVATVGLALTLKLVAWSTGAGACGAAALDHEVRNHTMESESVVISAGGKVQEGGNSNRSIIREGCDIDVAFTRVDSDFNIVHEAERIRKLRARVQTEVSGFLPLLSPLTGYSGFFSIQPRLTRKPSASLSVIR